MNCYAPKCDKEKFIIVVILCLLSVASCDDFLKETPNGQITTEITFLRSSDLEGAVHVLYRRIGRAMYDLNQFIQSQMGDDLSTNTYSSFGMIREWDEMDVSTTNNRSLIGWENKYMVIKAANFIINGVEKTPGVTKADIEYALGQAYFWRAWAYFYLVRTYGPLPKIVSLQVDVPVGLSTVAEIYKFIVEDLKKAENLLLANYTGVPRTMNGVNVVASKGAVQAVLSCVYMTMAGWPLEYGADYYNLAAAEALKVIEGANSGVYYYKLYDEFRLIHSKQENFKNTEAICAAYFSLALGEGSESDAARSCISDIPITNGGWEDTNAEIGFWYYFPAGPRKLATYPEWIFFHNFTTGAEGFCRWWDERTSMFSRQPYFGKSGFTVAGSTAEYDFKQFVMPQADYWSDQTHQMVRLS